MKERQKGFAVLVALFTLILLGALCTAMAFAISENSRASAGELAAAKTLAAAENAIANRLATQDWSQAMLLPAGQRLTIHLTDGLPVEVMIARLDSTLFHVQAIAPDPIAVVANERFIRRVALTIEVGADSAGILRPLRVPSRGWTELF